MTTSSLCPFCDPKQNYREIITGKSLRVLYPKNPSCEYHILIIPKRHIQIFDQFEPGEINEIYTTVKKMHQLLRQHLGDNYTGYTLLAHSGGPEIGQHLTHHHMHMFNRTKSDTGDPIRKVRKHRDTLNAKEKQILQTIQEWARHITI